MSDKDTKYITTFNQTESDERAYMTEVINMMKTECIVLDTRILGDVKAMKEYKEYLWENQSEMDRAEKSSVRNNVAQSAESAEAIVERKKRLQKMMEIPYFGRIDFETKEDLDIPLSIYIGIHSFANPKTHESVIYDWRSPIATMFYDYELGDTSYEAPNGKVEGNIMLKRQFRIRKSIMELMIENSINIDDDILQKELSTTSDERMKNIVATIQKEQNAIIRNEDARNLIIQGVAGSGKTSIALHRVAYILYRFKGQITSKDILIISPNKVFSDFISNVLPELGEENIAELGMEDVINNALGGKYKYQTFFEQVTDILDHKDPKTIESVKFKSSLDFVKLIDQYLVWLENNCLETQDVMIGVIPVAREWIEERFKALHRQPMRSRMDIVAKEIKEELKSKFRRELTTQEMTRIRTELRKMVKLGTDLAVYTKMYEWCGHPEYFRKLKGNKLEYADIAPLAYIKIALEGLAAPSPVKHLLVDEMQDYSPIQYRLLTKLFTCKKTILGDASQSVNPFSSTDCDSISASVYQADIMKLCKSYRSSYEITEFAQHISPSKDFEAIERHGEKPHVIECSSDKEEVAKLESLINDFDNRNASSLGIICKRESEAIALYEQIKNSSERVCLLTSDCAAFTDGVIVTTSHMSKGLEFDEVIVPHANKDNYNDDMDRSLLYISCTRAMHRLTLTFSGEKCEFVQ